MTAGARFAPPAGSALRPLRGELDLDASGLRFVDHRCGTLLDDFARRRSAVAVLRTPRPVAMLDLAHVRVTAA